MPGIFITYRREDSRADSGRLSKELKSYFGKDQIFRDIDAIEPGMDFVKAINSAVGSCGVLLVIIGPNWLSCKDENGHRRLENPDDYVRLEIEAALNRDIRVIPLLVGGAVMPRESDLPASLSPLARRQAYELSEGRWDYDVERLAARLRAIPGVKKRLRLAETFKKTITKRNEHSPDQMDIVGKSSTKTEQIMMFLLLMIIIIIGMLLVVAGLGEGNFIVPILGLIFLGGAFWLAQKFRSKRSGVE